MILCVCRRLNERAVREAVKAGAATPKAVQAHHGCQFNCGKCKSAIAEAIAKEHTPLAAGARMLAAE